MIIMSLQIYKKIRPYMINRIKIHNFKSFSEFDMKFQTFNLLVGANNSGKTTIFHALRFLFWLIERTVRTDSKVVEFGKVQTTAFRDVPSIDAKDIFYQRKVRRGKKPERVVIEAEIYLKNSSGININKEIRFEIYQAYATNFMIDGSMNKKMSIREYDCLKELRPIYVPGLAGVTTNEDLYRPIARERYISEGRHNEILRNMLYEISKRKSDWKRFIKSLESLFKITNLEIPFDETRDEWITALYKEDGKYFLDIISAGSGFQQIIQLLAFLHLHKPKVLLLDEPDAHLHSDLQNSTLRLIKNLSQERSIQILMATHSPTFIDATPLEEILLIDKNRKEPGKFQSDAEVETELQSHGIQIVKTKLTEALKSQRVLFVENDENDYLSFLKSFGELAYEDFPIRCKDLVVISIGDGNPDWPYDAIEAFNKLVHSNVKYMYLRDKDHLTESEIQNILDRVKKNKKNWKCLHRRNRENYFIEPKVLAKVIKTKLKKMGSGISHQGFTEKKIEEFFLKECQEKEDEERSKFMMQHERIIKGSASERSQINTELNKDFTKKYSQQLLSGKIPHFYADGKRLIKAFRTHLQTELKISISDKEIIGGFSKADIPKDLFDVLKEVRDLYEPVSDLPKELQRNQF